jgi:transposase
MFGWGPATRICLAAGATDMRKGFEGLYGLARDRLLCEPLNGHVFLFADAPRNRLKLLFWDSCDVTDYVELTQARASLSPL